MGWTLPPGQAGDRPQAEGLLAPWRAPAQAIVADTAHASDALRQAIAQAGANAVMPPTPRRKNIPLVTPLAYAKRQYSDQTCRPVKQHRRIAPRYDKLDRSYESFLCLRIGTLYLN